MKLLQVNNLQAQIDGTPILKGVDLTVQTGQTHVIMGPNGSGKSTLANVLAGNEVYEVTGGNVSLVGNDLLDLSVAERARAGLFLGFQYPVALPGVSTRTFLQSAINERRGQQDKDPFDAFEVDETLKKMAKQLAISPEFLDRPLNEGFSGGEKKRAEILQLLTLRPKLAILDETDSGLDVDALKTVAKGIAQYRTQDNGLIVITHYERLLRYLEPDVVHVFSDGKIVASGGQELVEQIEKEGYESFVS